MVSVLFSWPMVSTSDHLLAEVDQPADFRRRGDGSRRRLRGRGKVGEEMVDYPLKSQYSPLLTHCWTIKITIFNSYLSR